MADDIVQIIENARVDATSLSEFMYYPATVTVNRRLAPPIHTLNYYLQYLEGLEKIYSQPTGTVEVNGEVVKTVRQSINDAIDSAILGDYQTTLEAELVQEVLRATNRENDIEDALDAEVIRATGVDGVISNSLNELEEEVSNFNSDLNAQKLDTGITVTSKISGQMLRSQSEKNSDIVSLKDFGAVGDKIADDTAAVQAAVNSGKPLYWGGIGDVYRITSEITINATSTIYWDSSGATVFFEPTTPKHSVIYIQLDGHNFNISDKLIIDANKKAFTGLRIFNNSDNPVTVYTNNSTVYRCYRASTTYSGGDGMYYRGNFSSVILDNPRVVDVGMAVGAGIEGFNGVTGITVVRNYNTEQKPHAIRINNPYIEEVYSEDLSYYADQDGIKVFTSYERNEALPNDTDVVINGGYFKNCLGRSIKSQCEFTKVSNSHFVRTRGFDRGYGNFEIDFQVGNGSVENITFLYDGSRPNAIVFSNSARGSLIKGVTSLASIQGVKGNIHNLTNGFSSIFSMEAVDIANAQYTISNVDIQSDDLQGIGYLTNERGSGSKVVIKISNINLRMVGAVVSRLSTNDINVTLDRVTNTRVIDCPPILLSVSTGKLELSCTSCKGLSTVKRISQTEAPTATLVSSIAPINHSGKSGLIVPINVILPASNTVAVGQFGYSSLSAFTAIISLNLNSESQAILMGGASALKMLNTSSSIVVSNTGSAPTTGTFGFWMDNGTLYVKNTASYEVVLTGLVIG